MAVSYVKFFQGFAGLDERMLLSEHPAVTDALRYVRGVPSGEALGAIHALYRRHAEDVLRVLEDGAKKHAGELVRGAVPAGSILSVCAPGTRIEAPPPSDYDRQVREFMDALSEPRCEFAVDERGERIVFAGGFALTGANYKPGPCPARKLPSREGDRLRDAVHPTGQARRQSEDRSAVAAPAGRRGCRRASLRAVVGRSGHPARPGRLHREPSRAKDTDLTRDSPEVPLGDIEAPPRAMSRLSRPMSQRA